MPKNTCAQRSFLSLLCCTLLLASCSSGTSLKTATGTLVTNNTGTFFSSSAGAQNDTLLLMEANVTAAEPGEDVTYVLTVHNTATMPLTRAMVAVTLPLGKLVVNSVPGGSMSDGRITWTIDQLAPGESTVLTFHGTLNSILAQGDKVRTVASLTAQSLGAPAMAQEEIAVGPRQEVAVPSVAVPSVSNSSAPSAVSPVATSPAYNFFMGGQGASSVAQMPKTATAGTALVVSQQADKTEARPGEAIQYTVWVRNASAQPISSITLQMSYSMRQMLITTAGGGTLAGDHLTWSIAVLQPGEAQHFTYTAKVQESLGKGDVVSTVVQVTAPGTNTQLSLGDVHVQTRYPEAGVEQKFFTSPDAGTPVLRPIAQ